jgi:hypothetical protein
VNYKIVSCALHTDSGGGGEEENTNLQNQVIDVEHMLGHVFKSLLYVRTCVNSFFYHVHTVHIDNYRSFFHQLMHNWIV